MFLIHTWPITLVLTTKVLWSSTSFFFFSGLLSYLAKIHKLIAALPLYCSIRLVCVFASSMGGVYLILAMTFDRFYGIIRPHKASSFNTVKRAKITSSIVIICCFIYNLPHAFLFVDRGSSCVPYAKNVGTLGTAYYWLSFIVNFSFPFVALLTMNSSIIHTIRTRMSLSTTNEQRLKTSDKQIFAILLLVTFSFLILSTPDYLIFLFNMVIDFNQSPEYKAQYYLFYSAAQKLWYVNHGINFFLYILSGTKFRNDFKGIFGCETTSLNPTNTSGFHGGSSNSVVIAVSNDSNK